MQSVTPCGLQDSHEATLSKGLFWSQSSTVLGAPNLKWNFEDKDTTGFQKSSTSYGHTACLMVLMSSPGMTGMTPYMVYGSFWILSLSSRCNSFPLTMEQSMRMMGDFFVFMTRYKLWFSFTVMWTDVLMTKPLFLMGTTKWRCLQVFPEEWCQPE